MSVPHQTCIAIFLQGISIFVLIDIVKFNDCLSQEEIIANIAIIVNDQRYCDYCNYSR